MDRHSIFERDNPEVPAIELRDRSPEPPSIISLAIDTDRMRDDVDTPLTS